MLGFVVNYLNWIEYTRNRTMIIGNSQLTFQPNPGNKPATKEKPLTKRIVSVWFSLWAHLGPNLDLPLKIGPVDQFRQGLDCRVGVRVRMGPRMPFYYLLEFWALLNEKCPSMSYSWKGIRGPRWARTIDPLIMSIIYWIPYVYTDLYVFVPVWFKYNLNVKDSMGLHWFVEKLAKKLAPFSKS